MVNIEAEGIQTELTGSALSVKLPPCTKIKASLTSPINVIQNNKTKMSQLINYQLL